MKILNFKAHTMLWALYFLFSIFVFAAPVRKAPWMPRSTCKESWSRFISSNLHLYDSKRDKNYKTFSDRLSRSDCRKEWTILVYMAADNDLSPYAFMDLYEMEAGYASGLNGAASTITTDLIVQLDTAKTNHIRRYHMFQSDEVYNNSLKKRDFLNKSEADIYSPVIEELSETKSPQSDLKKFLKWGVVSYPADYYMVIVWGHGQGWSSGPLSKKELKSKYLNEDATQLEGVEDAARNQVKDSGDFSGRRFGGLAFDDTQKSFLGIPQLSRVLNELVKEELHGEPLDVYASDACLMQMAEVAYEISDAANFVEGSTKVQDLMGLQ